MESIFVSKVANGYQSTERVNIAVFSCYLWAISFLGLLNVGLFFIISNLVSVGICWVIIIIRVIFNILYNSISNNSSSIIFEIYILEKVDNVKVVKVLGSSISRC